MVLLLLVLMLLLFKAWRGWYGCYSALVRLSITLVSLFWVLRLVISSDAVSRWSLVALSQLSLCVLGQDCNNRAPHRRS